MNKVMLIGYVGTDPEVRYVDQGVAVARFRFATTEKGYTLQNGTQVPDHIDWHNILLWRRLAEIVEKYVHRTGLHPDEIAVFKGLDRAASLQESLLESVDGRARERRPVGAHGIQKIADLRLLPVVRLPVRGKQAVRMKPA